MGVVFCCAETTMEAAIMMNHSLYGALDEEGAAVVHNDARDAHLAATESQRLVPAEAPRDEVAGRRRVGGDAWATMAIAFVLVLLVGALSVSATARRDDGRSVAPMMMGSSLASNAATALGPPSDAADDLDDDEDLPRIGVHGGGANRTRAAFFGRTWWNLK